VVWDDYVEAQIDVIDTVRGGLKVDAVHAIGYCVAGTTLAATLAVLAARDQAAKVKSATFFTAQVDFARAGELLNFVDDEQLAMIRNLAPEGFIDGRYMALTFNLLRGRDLIWNYVTNNYLLGQDYVPFDLLHWNGDTTNLPAKWHMSYLTDLYRDNLLVKPGSLSVSGTPIDLTRVKTPSYIQAGREDHIAPAESVWNITHIFGGPMKFVLAGSGHIAGVVNPPALGKYQYWLNPAPVGTLAEFIAGATETKGSWWPDWLAWLHDRDDSTVPAKGDRVPGEGTLRAGENAPGRYVRER
jgi:polyhydroxyalkanoate synthase